MSDNASSTDDDYTTDDSDAGTATTDQLGQRAYRNDLHNNDEHKCDHDDNTIPPTPYSTIDEVISIRSDMLSEGASFLSQRRCPPDQDRVSTRRTDLPTNYDQPDANHDDDVTNFITMSDTPTLPTRYPTTNGTAPSSMNNTTSTTTIHTVAAPPLPAPPHHYSTDEPPRMIMGLGSTRFKSIREHPQRVWG